MFFANNALGQKIHIDDAETGLPYFCPACRDAMIQKRGNINAHNFAHKTGKGCDPWYSEKLSPWHIKMQNHFDRVVQETVVWNEMHTEYHVADIVLQSGDKKYVIEFQHSPISQKEFISRTKFYLGCGYTIIWVFDFCECKSQKTIFVSEYNNGIMHLAWPGKDRVKFLDNINFTSVNDGLYIFFYINAGMGKIRLHDPEGYYPWKTWEYIDPFSLHSCFALLYLGIFDNTKDFFAEYFSEENFFRTVKRLGK